MFVFVSVAASVCNRMIQSFVLLVLHSEAPASGLSCDSSFGCGRAIALAFSRWLSTAAARVRVRVEQMRFMVDKVALGQISSEFFGFTCQLSFHQFLHHQNHPGLAD
jgi:hypothetical protein